MRTIHTRNDDIGRTMVWCHRPFVPLCLRPSIPPFIRPYNLNHHTTSVQFSVLILSTSAFFDPGVLDRSRTRLNSSSLSSSTEFFKEDPPLSFVCTEGHAMLGILWLLANQCCFYVTWLQSDSSSLISGPSTVTACQLRPGPPEQWAALKMLGGADL